MEEFIKSKINKIDRALAKVEVQLYTDKDIQVMLGELDKVEQAVSDMKWFLRAEIKGEQE
ncbi:gp147 [Bacillus phage W.Ph.]|uniref:Gp147 n=1 Tax=Bacillus phage W.Ph. TaxID=764595 RepID=G9B1P8_9CAUD|nr:gp147 [Bacillus phage W.Ph.]ADH03293.1 gp147 [Bacillus phage W.Ph.]